MNSKPDFRYHRLQQPLPFKLDTSNTVPNVRSYWIFVTNIMLTKFTVRLIVQDFYRCGKKVSPKVVCYFLSNCVEYYSEISHSYYLFIPE